MTPEPLPIKLPGQMEIEECIAEAEKEARLYDVARQVTDEVFGDGAYAELNKSNPDPRVQAAIKKEAK